MIRYSSRIRQDVAPNKLSRALERKRSEHAAILDLTVSNPTTAGINYPRELLQALADPRSLFYDPLPFGLATAREAVAQYYSPPISPSRVLLTASTSEAYSYLFKLLCEAGDEILIPKPSYPLFEFLASLESVRAVPYPLYYDHGWFIDLHALRQAVSPRTRAIVVVNPNNPTGSFLKRSERAELAKLCAENLMCIVSDEVFFDYAFDLDASRAESFAHAADVPAFSLSGLSKVSGLPQVKLGWIVAAGPTDAASESLARLELIADTFLGVSTPVQWAAPALLQIREIVQPQIKTRTRTNLDWLSARLKNTPLRVLGVEAGWYATVQVPRVRSEEEWALALLQTHDVHVQPGFFYDFETEAFLILSLLTPEPEFREGVERLGILCNSLC